MRCYTCPPRIWPASRSDGTGDWDPFGTERLGGKGARQALGIRNPRPPLSEASCWTIEEVAYYLGHITKKGVPAIQTTARYTQVSREESEDKLKLLRS